MADRLRLESFRKLQFYAQLIISLFLFLGIFKAASSPFMLSRSAFAMEANNILVCFSIAMGGAIFIIIGMVRFVGIISIKIRLHVALLTACAAYLLRISARHGLCLMAFNHAAVVRLTSKVNESFRLFLRNIFLMCVNCSFLFATTICEGDARFST